jgi:hypothetical protein
MNLRGKFIPKNLWMHCLSISIVVIFTLVLTNTGRAQAPLAVGIPFALPDTAIRSFNDQLDIIDTTGLLRSLLLPETYADTLSDRTGTVSGGSLEETLGIRISPDALPSPVRSEAADSAVLDMESNVFYLYRDALVFYEDLKLDAGRIVYNQNTSRVTASPLTDSLGVREDRKLTFTQGPETFIYDSLQYNFKSKRAIVRNARTQYGEGFVHSHQVKRNEDHSIYGWKNIYTTCALDTPHFGIRARKIKVIPNRIIASGPANIMVEMVPTPVFLPVGIFPISEGQRSGFRMPAYTIEEQRGLGLTNGGYYFYLNDYVDLLLLGNVYSKGSWSGSAISTYASRYQFNGGLSLSYAYNKTGESYEPNSSVIRDFMVNWRHTTDAKARPGVSFNASVTAGTSSFYANNSYNPNQILQNQYQSNIAFSKTWPYKPYNLTVGARHNQNTQTGQVNVTLPELNFYLGQYNPFQKKNALGVRWYDKITVGYTLNALNQLSFYDSAFSFSALSANQFRNGLRHSVPLTAAYTVFRFFNLSFGANYNEYWLTERRYQYFDTRSYELDTVDYRGFYAARDIDLTTQVSTRIYGTKMFRNGRLMGIRHVLTPNVGFNYKPDYAARPFHYYYQTRLGAEAPPVYLSPYDGSVVGVPGLGQYGDFSSSILYGLNNNLQIKTRSNKDTVTGSQNVTLIDGLSVSGSYNLAADSFKWSPVAASFRTSILNLVNISANAAFDPYTLDYETGRRIPTSSWDAGRGLVRFTSSSVALSATYRSKQRSGKTNPAAKSDEYERLMKHAGDDDYIDFTIPFSVNLAYALTMTNTYQAATKHDSIIYSQNVMLSGDFSITKNWKLAYSTGYDFRLKQLTFTSVDIYRDLHCWEMRLSTIPFGPRKSFTFMLNVKASILQDLRLQRRRDFRDAVY